MLDYHIHSHYEISFILQGDVSILLSDCIHSGTVPRIVMLPPYSPHQMILEPGVTYRHMNVSFTENFISRFSDEWHRICSVFGRKGKIFFPNENQCSYIEQIVRIMDSDDDLLRNRHLVICFVSWLNEQFGETNGEWEKTPHYLISCMEYMREHFAEKITAEMLEEYVGVGRTTLILKFRNFVGITLHQYLELLRLNHASRLRGERMSLSEIAEQCGFYDASAYVRAHRRVYGTTPTGKK
jgi:AraC-like DNA-binding protein